MAQAFLPVLPSCPIVVHERQSCPASGLEVGARARWRVGGVAVKCLSINMLAVRHRWRTRSGAGGPAPASLQPYGSAWPADGLPLTVLVILGPGIRRQRRGGL